MTQLEKTKYDAISSLHALCARCQQQVEHNCPVREVVERIRDLDGIPVIVNDRLRHVVFN